MILGQAYSLSMRRGIIAALHLSVIASQHVIELRGKSSATTEKGLERVGEILQAARKIFAAQGYAGLSMRRVAAQVA